MKMVFVSYSESVEDEMMELLEKLGIQSFTKWKDVLDRGETGHPRFGTHVWPGLNAAFATALEDDRAKVLFAEIERFNAGLKFEKVKAFAWELAQVI